VAQQPVPSRQTPLSGDLGRLVRGVPPQDAGALSNITDKSAARIRATDAVAARFLRPYITSNTLVRGVHRWCLRLTSGDAATASKSPEIQERVARAARARPKDHPLPPWALVDERTYPPRFIAVPRRFPGVLEMVPVISFDQGEVAGDQVWLITDNHLLTAGVVSSRFYRVWLAEVSRSAGPEVGVGAHSAHNTFPLPKLTEGQRGRIEEAAERMLLARSYAMDSDFDELYSRSRMPKPLRDAHDDIDAVLAEVFGVDVEAGDARLRKVLRDTHRKLSNEQGGHAA
jgi:hypothetical protein